MLKPIAGQSSTLGVQEPGRPGIATSACTRPRNCVSRQSTRAQRNQVRVFELGIDQRPAPAAQQAGKAGQRQLGATGLRAEHALAEKHPADRDPIDSTDQRVPREDLDAVRVAEAMQFDIGRDHVRP